jgi:hypothetical protein
MHSGFRARVWFSLNQMEPRTVSWNGVEWWVPVLPWGSMTAERFCQFGRLSFFKNAVYRGSLCKLFSRGSTFVPIILGSC